MPHRQDSPHKEHICLQLTNSAVTILETPRVTSMPLEIGNAMAFAFWLWNNIYEHLRRMAKMCSSKNGIIWEGRNWHGPTHHVLLCSRICDHFHKFPFLDSIQCDGLVPLSLSLRKPRTYNEVTTYPSNPICLNTWDPECRCWFRRQYNL